MRFYTLIIVFILEGLVHVNVDLHLPLILQGDILLLNCTYGTQTRTGVTLVSPDIGSMFKNTFYMLTFVSTILTH